MPGPLAPLARPGVCTVHGLGQGCTGSPRKWGFGDSCGSKRGAGGAELRPGAAARSPVEPRRKPGMIAGCDRPHVPGASRTHTAASGPPAVREGGGRPRSFSCFRPKEKKAPLFLGFSQRLRRHPRNQSGPLRQPYDQSCSFTSAVLVQRISASHSAENDPHESPKSPEMWIGPSWLVSWPANGTPSYIADNFKACVGRPGADCSAIQ